MNKERRENQEAQFRVGVVGSKGDKTFRKLVKGNSNRCLETDGQESIFSNMMMMRSGRFAGVFIGQQH